ncbi:MAG: methylenetetrahydrofolate reductase C-terminal domain-containing protein [Dehalococcoidia bacterium]|jgi:ferredoxin|nr:methylenetetrahydrofolate reductase C-terminal domain-containing protein [Chloroflexota bacterium]MCK4242108.1 methylenetetrahydrofolate reductase C-terminal domain-containing protein [Dehalococcoidia bacterium]
MIVAERKPLEEIKEMIAGYKRILIVGCGTCVTICWAGGEKEVGILSSQLRLAFGKDGNELLTSEVTIERQCEREMVEELRDKVQEVEAILSLGCGAGVQTIAEVFEETPVYPALNTKFVGMPEREGVWVETCRACGDCLLGETGGICPVVRCAKGLLNGPCGGTKRGKCEVDPEKDCAWTLIYRRLEKQGRLDLMRKYYPPRNFQAVTRPGKVEALQA